MRGNKNDILVKMFFHLITTNLTAMAKLNYIKDEDAGEIIKKLEDIVYER